MEQKSEVIELDYPAPTLGRNIGSRLLDIVLFLILSMVLLLIPVFGVPSLPGYQKAMDQIVEVKKDSNLYAMADDGELYNLYAYYDDSEFSFDERSDRIDTALCDFFGRYIDDELNGEGYQVYLDILKEQKTNSGEAMFDANGNRLLTNDDYDLEYYQCYGNIVESTALGYLDLKGEYLSLKKKTSAYYLVGCALMVVLAFAITYLIIPSILSRGKRTFGMYICKLSLLSSDGLSCRYGRFFARFALQFFLLFLGSLVCFFIPLMVSITMIVVMKSHQSLSDYISNTYLVSTADQSVYVDTSELMIATKSTGK